MRRVRSGHPPFRTIHPAPSHLSRCPGPDPPAPSPPTPTNPHIHVSSQRQASGAPGITPQPPKSPTLAPPLFKETWARVSATAGSGAPPGSSRGSSSCTSPRRLVWRRKPHSPPRRSLSGCPTPSATHRGTRATTSSVAAPSHRRRRTACVTWSVAPTIRGASRHGGVRAGARRKATGLSLIPENSDMPLRRVRGGTGTHGT